MAESQNIEYKTSWHDDHLKIICGFANANGGKLFIGTDDRGKIIGIENFSRLLEDIPNKIKNHLGIITETNLIGFSPTNYIESIVLGYT